VANAGMYGAIGSLAGSLIIYAVSNPTVDNFNSYSNRKIVYIDCLFDTNNNHVDGTVNPLAFDKIQDYVEKNKKLASPTIFKLANVYYFGNYNTDSKTYELRKFTD
jgi:flagellar motor component MotA